jgi:hypothetical protein
MVCLKDRVNNLLSYQMCKNAVLWIVVSTLCATVTEVEANLAAQNLIITSDKPQEELLAALQKTGKKVEYVGQIS